jgi:antitoxin component YwqK of YwqJK toxin-antitoxin module
MVGCRGKPAAPPLPPIVQDQPARDWWVSGICPWSGAIRRSGAAQVWCELRGIRHGYYARIDTGRVTVGVFQHGLEHGVRREFNRAGTLTASTRYVRGRRHGGAVRYASDGGLLRGSFFRDRKHGTWTTYSRFGGAHRHRIWRHGRLISSRDVPVDDFDFSDAPSLWWTRPQPCPRGAGIVGSVEANEIYCAVENDRLSVLHGAYTAWHHAGRIKAQGNHFAEKRHGRWIEWSVDGNKIAERSYRHGKQHGPERTWSDWSGALETEGQWQSGRRHGRFRDYHENGQLAEDRRYERGVLVGPTHSYNDLGVLILSGSYTSRGAMDGVWTRYYGTGQVSHTTTFREGERHGPYNHLGLHGAPQTTGEYKDGVKHGTWIEFTTEGAVLQSVEYRHGLEHGAFVEYDGQGNVTTVGRYVDGSKHGTWKTRALGATWREAYWDLGAYRGGKNVDSGP